MIHMHRRLYPLLISLSLIAAPIGVFAETGFVDEPLWLTPEAPKEGDMVTLSTVFHNAESRQIVGIMVFYDGDIILGRKPLSIAAGAIGAANVTFKIAPGKHAFSARMSNLSETTSMGTSMPLVLPLSKAEIPEVVVPTGPEKFFTAQTTSSKTATSGDQSAILKQVDKIETSALSVVPDSVKESISDTASGVDDWRSDTASSFTLAKSNAKKESEAISKEKQKEIKQFGKVSASTKYIDSPWASIKLMFFSILALFFGSRVVFYILGSLIAFVIIRGILRKLFHWFRSRRENKRKAKYPKAPEI